MPNNGLLSSFAPASFVFWYSRGYIYWSWNMQITRMDSLIQPWIVVIMIPKSMFLITIEFHPNFWIQQVTKVYSRLFPKEHFVNEIHFSLVLNYIKSLYVYFRSSLLYTFERYSWAIHSFRSEFQILWWPGGRYRMLTNRR